MDLTFPVLPVEGDTDYDAKANNLIDYFCNTYIDMCNTTKTDVDTALSEILATSSTIAPIDDSAASAVKTYSSDKIMGITPRYEAQAFYFCYSGNSSFKLGYDAGIDSPYTNRIMYGGIFHYSSFPRTGSLVLNVRNIDSSDYMSYDMGNVHTYTELDNEGSAEQEIQTVNSNMEFYPSEISTYLVYGLFAIVMKG